MTTRAHIVVIGPGFREYRRAFLLEAREMLLAEGITSLFCHAGAPLHTTQRDEVADTSPSVPLRAFRVRVRSREVIVSRLPRRWRHADLVVLPEASGYLSLWPVFLYRRVRKRRTAIFGHGADFSRLSSRDLPERLRSWRAARVDRWFAYNERSAAEVERRGVPRVRITVVNNTVDTASLVAHVSHWTPVLRAAAREAMGLGAGPVALFMGALHENKRVPDLVAIADRVHDVLPGFRLLVVGDGAFAEHLDQLASARPWLIHVAGDTSPRRAEYWAVADLALYPAAAGLAVVEALALGVPVVVGGSAPQMPEASYVIDGENGLVVHGGPEAIARTVITLLGDPRRLASLSACARRSGALLSIDEMARRFVSGVLAVLDLPPLETGVDPRGQPAPTLQQGPRRAGS